MGPRTSATPPDPAQREERMGRLADLPVRLSEAVEDLDDARLDSSYREGGWSVRQLVHHLADAHTHGWVRVKFALAQEHPTLQPYDQDLWAATEDARAAPIEVSLAMIAVLHARLASLFANLDEGAWSRRAFHPEVGELTLDDLLATYADHGDHHLQQILDLRAARGW